MNRNERALGGVGRRLLGALAMWSPIAMAMGACSESPPVEIADGETTSGDVLDENDPRVARCGETGVACGALGCCVSGNVCSDFGRCIPAGTCTDNEQCSADSTCGGTTCVPYADLPQDAAYNRSCRTAVDLPSLVPQVQCQWPKPGDPPPAVEPNKVQVIGTPMVVDFDFDDSPEVRPSIVFVSYENNFAQETGVLRVIDGRTCDLQDTIIGLNPFTPEVPVALGDINADGRPDIVVADEAPIGAAVQSGIAAFEAKADGSTTFKELGRIASSGTGIIKGFAIHDVDGDEYPEILTEKTILRFDRNLRTLVNMAALQRANRPELTGIEPPIVTDVDGDRSAEIVTSQGVFYWNTELNDIADKARVGDEPLWNDNQNVNGAFIAIANLGNFPTGLPQGADSAELIIVSAAGELWVKRVDGGVVLNLASARLAGGPPIVADFDGDGRMEFAAPGQQKLTVFDLDCHPDTFNQAGCGRGSGQRNANAVLWEKQTQGARSGAAVFDFNGDGRSEVVYADQCFMRIYDGLRGDVIFSSPRGSLTQWEYPVVADVDGDSFSEIVTASNITSVVCPETDPYNETATVRFVPFAGVTVWREAGDRWAGSRPVWNQHNYFVTNVNDDGTIPPMGGVKNHWDLVRGGGPNTFRQNVQGATGSSLDLVDVTTAGVAAFNCLEGQDVAEVTVDLCNRGNAPLRPAQASIALVQASQPTNILCRKSNTELITQNLAPGDCTEVKCNIPITRELSPLDVTILGDPTNSINECFENNNSSTISRISCVRDIQ